MLGNNLIVPLWRIIRGEQLSPPFNSTIVTVVRLTAASPEEILQKNGVDPYVFVRFLIMMSKVMIPIWLLSWLVLLPVDSANTGVGGKTGLDRFTFGNVAGEDQDRLWAHLILDYLFIGESERFCAVCAHCRLDDLPHVGGDEALAHCSTKVPD